MTDLSILDTATGGRASGAVRAQAPARRSRWSSASWPTWLYATALPAGAAGWAVALAAPAVERPEWQLVLLLRFMAVVKAGMVLAALGLTHWRVRQPIGNGFAAGYVGSVALMMLAPGLIWSLAHIALGAGLFHLGFIAYLILAWRDGMTDRAFAARAGN